MSVDLERPKRLALPRGWFDASGLCVWFAFGLTVAALVLIEDAKRSVLPAYRLGSERFFAGDPLYDVQTAMGYLYPPGFAALTAPFWSIGSPWDEVVWRMIGFGLLTYALIRQALSLGGEKTLWTISVAAFFAIPLSAGAMRNDQTTILLAATCWLMLIAALEGRPRAMAIWGVLALLAKPTAIVILLLIAALRPRFIPWLLLAVLAVVGAPFAVAAPGYVAGQTVEFFSLVTAMSAKPGVVFVPADFTAPLARLDLLPSQAVVLAIRVAGALAVLAVVLIIDRTWRVSTAQATLAIFVVATFYMSVFNPRVEHNTYALLALPFALVIARLMQRGLFRTGLALGLLLAAAGLTGVHPLIHHATEFWFGPVVITFVFLALAVTLLVERRVLGIRTGKPVNAAP
jgi:hypothetical protein